MRDVFYTILVVWILWRIVNSYNSYNYNRKNNRFAQNHDAEQNNTTLRYNSSVNKKIKDDEGEYVDFEDIK